MDLEISQKIGLKKESPESRNGFRDRRPKEDNYLLDNFD